MKTPLKSIVPYLIVAQTLMLATITIVTLRSTTSRTIFGCTMVDSNKVICVQKLK
jgi:deoxycytidylate deaminase